MSEETWTEGQNLLNDLIGATARTTLWQHRADALLADLKQAEQKLDEAAHEENNIRESLNRYIKDESKLALNGEDA